MPNLNFGKDIRELADDELFRHINNAQPDFAALCEYELLRRLAIKNEESSKRFAWWSLSISVVAILIAFYQAQLSKIQVVPILQGQQKNERQAYEFCKEPGNKEQSWPGAEGGRIPCLEVLEMLKNKFQT